MTDNRMIAVLVSALTLIGLLTWCTVRQSRPTTTAPAVTQAAQKCRSQLSALQERADAISAELERLERLEFYCVAGERLGPIRGAR